MAKWNHRPKSKSLRMPGVTCGEKNFLGKKKSAHGHYARRPYNIVRVCASGDNEKRLRKSLIDDHQRTVWVKQEIIMIKKKKNEKNTQTTELNDRAQWKPFISRVLWQRATLTLLTAQETQKIECALDNHSSRCHDVIIIIIIMIDRYVDHRLASIIGGESRK